MSREPTIVWAVTTDDPACWPKAVAIVSDGPDLEARVEHLVRGVYDDPNAYEYKWQSGKMLQVLELDREGPYIRFHRLVETWSCVCYHLDGYWRPVLGAMAPAGSLKDTQPTEEPK